MKIIGERYKWKWINWIILDVNYINDKIVLTVPENTVMQEYSADLK